MQIETIKRAAKELFSKLLWGNMEFYVCSNGIIGERNINSFSEEEDKIIYKVPLSYWYWHDILIDQYIEPNDIESSDAYTKNAFIDYLEDNIKEAIENLGFEIEY